MTSILGDLVNGEIHISSEEMDRVRSALVNTNIPFYIANPSFVISVNLRVKHSDAGAPLSPATEIY